MPDLLVTILASGLIWVMITGLLVLWVIDGRIKREQALHAFYAMLVAWVVSEMLKSLIPSLRPFRINGYPPLTLTVPFGNAFPSTHTAISFALAATIWFHSREWGGAYLVMAAVVGIARILGNVHYPVDVLAGAVIGLLVAAVVDKIHLFKLLSKRRT